MRVLKKIYNSFFTTLGLLSRIPIKVSYIPDFSMFPFFMPVTGLIFFLIMLPITALSVIFIKTPLICTTIILFIQYSAFNIFHFDGLLDSADALFYNTTPEKRLDILKDKTTGSFASFSGAFYLIIKISTLASLLGTLITTPSLSLVIILFYIPAGRIAGALIPVILSPAREDGLGSLLKKYSRKLYFSGVFSALLIPVLLLTSTGGSFMILLYAAAGALLGGLMVSGIYKKKIGGFTGDAIGLGVEIGELFYLLTLVETLARR